MKFGQPHRKRVGHSAAYAWLNCPFPGYLKPVYWCDAYLTIGANVDEVSLWGIGDVLNPVGPGRRWPQGKSFAMFRFQHGWFAQLTHFGILAKLEPKGNNRSWKVPLHNVDSPLALGNGVLSKRFSIPDRCAHQRPTHPLLRVSDPGRELRGKPIRCALSLGELKRTP